MTAPPGILISSFDYSPVAEDEFHDWYDTEHIPERERIPGFLQCRRWIGVDHPKVSLNTYELASVAVLGEPGYLAVGYQNNSPWTRRVGWRCIARLRFEGEQTTPGAAPPPSDARGLLVIGLNLDAGAPDDEAEFERWCRDVHVRATEALAGVLRVRHFRATRSTHRHVLIHHLVDPAVATRPDFADTLADGLAARFGPSIRDRIYTRCRAYVRAAG